MAEFHRCHVTRAGPAEDGKIYIGLITFAMPPRPSWNLWYFANPKMQKEMLDVALVAITTGYAVDAALVQPGHEYTEIERLYVIRS